MPKNFKWWSVVQATMVGILVAATAKYAKHDWLAFVLIGVNGLIYGLGEMLNQSSADLREHANELLRLTKSK